MHLLASIAQKKTVKRYNLIQWYPGLPNDWKFAGDVVVQQNPADGKYFFQKEAPHTRTFLSAKDVEENSFFWQLVPEKLFTTEDGVDVFPGDSWYYVAEGSEEVKETSTVNYTGKNPKPVKRFKNRDAAELEATCNKAVRLIKAMQGLPNDANILVNIQAYVQA